VFPLLRTIMVGPVLGVGRTHNPIMAIRASLALTRGNTGRILAFLALAMVLFAIVEQRGDDGGRPAQRASCWAPKSDARLLNEAISALLYSAGSPISWRCWPAIHGQLTRDLPRPFT
jgi:hypothetical protein